MYAIKELQNTTIFAHRGMYMSTQMKGPIVQGAWLLVNIRYKDIKVKKSLLPWKRVGAGQFSNEAERQAGDRL